MKDEFYFPDDFNGFSRVEYLSIFVALMYAFAVAEFFSGWSRMVRQRDGIIFSVDHLIWTFLFFWLLIINWYVLWTRIEYLNKGFLYFVISLLPIIIIYLGSIFMFPDFDKYKDMKVYYEKYFNSIIILIGIFVTLNVIIGFWLGEIKLFSELAIVRLINSAFMFTVGIFNLKFLRRPLAAFVFIGLAIGSFKIAFV